MCNRCEDLEEEVAYLRGLLGEEEGARRVEDLRVRFKLRTISVRVLERLYAARGRLVDYATLLEVFADPDRAALGNDLQMAVSYVRNALGGRYAVENFKGAGYRLSAIGVSRVQEALAAAPRVDRSPYTYQRKGPKNRRLTDQQVRELRAAPRGMSRVLGEQLGITESMACQIRSRKQYRDVPDFDPLDPTAAPKPWVVVTKRRRSPAPGPTSTEGEDR